MQDANKNPIFGFHKMKDMFQDSLAKNPAKATLEHTKAMLEAFKLIDNWFESQSRFISLARLHEQHLNLDEEGPKAPPTPVLDLD